MLWQRWFTYIYTITFYVTPTEEAAAVLLALERSPTPVVCLYLGDQSNEATGKQSNSRPLEELERMLSTKYSSLLEGNTKFSMLVDEERLVELFQFVSDSECFFLSWGG